MICDLTDRADDLDWLTTSPLIDPDRLSGKTSFVRPANGFSAVGGVLSAALAARRRGLA